MGKAKTAVVLINLGTPDSPKVSDVRRYLREFLSDKRVIDVSWLGRMLLVNLIIAPFRAPKSAKEYQKLWTDRGSPLMYHGEDLRDKVQAILGEDYIVELAMRYQSPSIENVLNSLHEKGVHKIVLMPLYPQYAASTTGSTIEECFRVMNHWWVIPEVSIVNQFFQDEGFLNAFVEKGRPYWESNKYDQVLFSFHGLPERQVDKVYEDGKPCADHNCELELTEDNLYCYKATCFATARMIAEKLGIPDDKYDVAFQSRLGRDPWIQPYADETIENYAKKGVKNLLVFSPAFVADCLETTVEIGEAYKEMFEEMGGEHLQLVESLNADDSWAKYVAEKVKSY